MARDLDGCCPAIEDDDLAGANHHGRCPSDQPFFVGCHTEP
jgi:hypothetical protein